MPYQNTVLFFETSGRKKPLPPTIVFLNEIKPHHNKDRDLKKDRKVPALL